MTIIFRICSAMIVAFWLVMMTLLVRQEFFPDLSGTLAVPGKRVLKTVLTAEDPSVLKVFYEGEEIGAATFRAEPMTRRGALQNEGQTPAEADDEGPAGYRVMLELRLVLPNSGKMSRFYLHTVTVMDAAFKIRSFAGKLRTEGINIMCDADLVREEMKLKLSQGDWEQIQVIDLKSFRDKNNPALAEALKSSDFGRVLSMLGLSADNPTASGTVPFSMTTTRASLEVSGQMVPTYLVTLKQRDSDALTIRLWIGAQGQILKLDSPFGLVMLAEGLRMDLPGKGRPRSRL